MADEPQDHPQPTEGAEQGDVQAASGAEQGDVQAASGATEQPSGEEAETTAIATQLPGAEEANRWAGWKLDAMTGGTIGRAEGVYVDADSGEPRWLLIRIGRFGHHSAVPYEHAVAGANRIWVPYDRDMVRQAPRVNAGDAFTRELELDLCGFYGIHDGVGRTAELADRAEGDVTARPAEPAA